MVSRLRKGLTPRDVVLYAGDFICFLIFAVLGLRSHEDGITADGILRAAVPFQVSWLAMTLMLRGQPGIGDITRSRNVIRVWIPALVLGLAIRSLVFGRAFAPDLRRRRLPGEWRPANPVALRHRPDARATGRVASVEQSSRVRPTMPARGPLLGLLGGAAADLFYGQDAPASGTLVCRCPVIPSHILDTVPPWNEDRMRTVLWHVVSHGLRFRRQSQETEGQSQNQP